MGKITAKESIRLGKKLADKVYECKDCHREVRVKAVTPELATMRLCPQCYTKRLTKEKATDLLRQRTRAQDAPEGWWR
jgi:DNA-directed RNA polymerase subunit RPC12/RpoP